VPEVDTPGHASALVQLYPELRTARNDVEFELPPGHKHHTAWLDPELPATFALLEEVLAGVAGIFPSAYLHIGGDEPRGMPHDLYAAYVERVRRLVRSLGRRPLGWQASLPPEVRAQAAANLARSRRDVEPAVAASCR
jgi:hexosaminidase